jgi:hypothetical protein
MELLTVDPLIISADFFSFLYNLIISWDWEKLGHLTLFCQATHPPFFFFFLLSQLDGNIIKGVN